MTFEKTIDKSGTKYRKENVDLMEKYYATLIQKIFYVVVGHFKQSKSIAHTCDGPLN